MADSLTRSVITRVQPLSFTQGSLLEQQLVADVSRKPGHVSSAVWWLEQCLVMPSKFGNIPNFAGIREEGIAMGWPFFLRNTGGDLMPQHPGFFNFSCAFRMSFLEKRSFSEAYQFLCMPLLDWIANRFSADPTLGSTSNSICNGDFNINVNGKKVAGTAQRWKVIEVPGAEKDVVVLGHAVVFACGPVELCVNIVNWFRDRTGTEGAVTAASHATLLPSEMRAEHQHFQCADLMRSFSKYLQSPKLFDHVSRHF